MLDRNVAVYAAFNVLVGVPHVMVNGDLNLGVAVLQ
jgi:hypothetical protein